MLEKDTKKVKKGIDLWDKTSRKINRLLRVNPNLFVKDPNPKPIYALWGNKADKGMWGFGHPLNVKPKVFLDSVWNKDKMSADFSSLITDTLPNTFIFYSALTHNKSRFTKELEIEQIYMERESIKKVLPFFMKQKREGTETFLLKQYDGKQIILHYQTDANKILDRYNVLTDLLISRHIEKKAMNKKIE